LHSRTWRRFGLRQSTATRFSVLVIALTANLQSTLQPKGGHAEQRFDSSSFIPLKSYPLSMKTIAELMS
jgi:hypothetical protein